MPKIVVGIVVLLVELLEYLASVREDILIDLRISVLEVDGVASLGFLPCDYHGGRIMNAGLLGRFRSEIDQHDADTRKVVDSFANFLSDVRMVEVAVLAIVPQ